MQVKCHQTTHLYVDIKHISITWDKKGSRPNKIAQKRKKNTI